jgi:AcrR family transcriptional regulator
MARRSEHSRDEIREMALKAAERIVVREGYRGLTTRKVAAAIGYTVGSLYMVFHGLEDLVVQVNERTLKELHGELEGAATRCRVPSTCITALAHAYVRFAEEQRGRWSMIFEHRWPQPMPPAYRAQVLRMFEFVENMLRRILPRVPAVEIRTAARALWSGVHGVCVLTLSGKLDTAGKVAVYPLVDSLVENYLNGLSAARRGERSRA